MQRERDHVERERERSWLVCLMGGLQIWIERGWRDFYQSKRRRDMRLTRREEVGGLLGNTRLMRISSFLCVLVILGSLGCIQFLYSSKFGDVLSVDGKLGSPSVFTAGKSNLGGGVKLGTAVSAAVTGGRNLGRSRGEGDLDRDAAYVDATVTGGKRFAGPRAEAEIDHGAPFTNMADAFRKWDSAIGCDSFSKSVRKLDTSDYNSRSLQSPDAVQCSELRLPRVTVVVKSKDWLVPSFFGNYSCNCGLTCSWTTSTVASNDADAHLFVTWSPARIRKRGEPLTAYMDLEAALEDPKDRQHLADMIVTYHARATVQATYATQMLQTNLNRHVSLEKNGDVPVFWASSRCVQERSEIASKFLSLVPHHSFGKCLNNVGGIGKELAMYPHCHENGAKESHWFNHINCAMSHYKFVLAIENTRTEGYATEKLFYALEAGSVPIYFGAPNVLDLVPPHSIVEGNKFASIEELASFVKTVAEDPVAYSRYHAWRRCGVQGPYNHSKAVSLETLPCRFCAMVSKLGGKAAPLTNPSQ